MANLPNTNADLIKQHYPPGGAAIFPGTAAALLAHWEYYPGAWARCFWRLGIENDPTIEAWGSPCNADAARYARYLWDPQGYKTGNTEQTAANTGFSFRSGDSLKAHPR